MALETAIVTKLLNTGAVTTIIENRIAAVTQPGAMARPNLTFQRVSTTGHQTNDGPIPTEFVRLQFNCWGEGKTAYKQACDLAAAVKAVLNGLTNTTVGAWKIQACRLDGEYDAPTAAPPGQSATYAGRVVDFVIGAKPAA